MTTQAAAHQRNLESAVLFMQQEHANTLKGLHEEIRNLQKKYSELTFHINMQGLDLGESGLATARVHEMQKQLEQQKETQTQVEHRLEESNRYIRDMELQLKKQKMKHMEEMRAKTQDSDRLRAEVESKSNQIAYLTSELHKLKRIQLENSVQAVSRPLTDTSHFVPMPPPPRDQQKIRRGIVRQSKPLVNPEVLEKMEIRVSSGRSPSSSRSDSPNELARPFLRHDDSDPQLSVKTSTRDPLPPIIRGSQPSREDKPRKQVFVHKVVPPPHSHAKHPASKTREVRLLAVDQVTPSEAKWGHAQESHSSEFN